MKSVKPLTQFLVKKLQSEARLRRESIEHLNVEVVLPDVAPHCLLVRVAEGEHVEAPDGAEVAALVHQVQEGLQGHFPVVTLKISQLGEVARLDQVQEERVQRARGEVEAVHVDAESLQPLHSEQHSLDEVDGNVAFKHQTLQLGKEDISVRNPLGGGEEDLAVESYGEAL